MNILMTLQTHIAKPFLLRYINSNSSYFGFYYPFLKIIIMRDIDDVPLIMINECGQCM